MPENLSLISSIMLRKLRPRQKEKCFFYNFFFYKLPLILSKVLSYTDHFGLEE